MLPQTQSALVKQDRGRELEPKTAVGSPDAVPNLDVVTHLENWVHKPHLSIIVCLTNPL